MIKCRCSRNISFLPFVFCLFQVCQQIQALFRFAVEMRYSLRKHVLAGTLILELLLNGYMGNLMAHFKIGNRKYIYIYTL